jgi:hypothetical protein
MLQKEIKGFPVLFNFSYKQIFWGSAPCFTGNNSACTVMKKNLTDLFNSFSFIKEITNARITPKSELKSNIAFVSLANLKFVFLSFSRFSYNFLICQPTKYCLFGFVFIFLRFQFLLSK